MLSAVERGMIEDGACELTEDGLPSIAGAIRRAVVKLDSALARVAELEKHLARESSKNVELEACLAEALIEGAQHRISQWASAEDDAVVIQPAGTVKMGPMAEATIIQTADTIEAGAMMIGYVAR